MKEGSPESIAAPQYTPEEAALLAVGNMRMSGNPPPEEVIREAEQKYLSLKHEREQAEGGQSGEEISTASEAEVEEEKTSKWKPTPIHEDVTAPIGFYSADELAKHVEWLDKRMAGGGERVKQRLADRSLEAQTRLRGMDSEPEILSEEAAPVSKAVDEAGRRFEQYKAARESQKERLDEHTAKAKKVTGISDDGKFAFVEGTNTEIPVEQLVPVEIPPELSPEATEIKQEIEKMPEEEKKKLAIGFGNIGFVVEEKKNDFFAKTFGWLSEKSEGKSATVSKFCSELRDSFVRDGEKARKNIEEVNSGKKKMVSNTLSLFGNTIKYGRSIADATGLTFASPLRYAMMAGMMFSRGAEAAKETRLKNEELISKTRIGKAEYAETEEDQKQKELDINEASEEAWRIYESAEKRTGEGKVSAEELKQSYMREMPKDLVERLRRDPGTTYGFIQNQLRREIAGQVNKLYATVALIESDNSLNPEEKGTAKDRAIRKQERNLHDYDRILSQYGTVDGLAMAGRYAQFAGKFLVGAMTVETVALLLSQDKLWENLSKVLTGPDAPDAPRPAALPRALADSAFAQTPVDTTDTLGKLDKTIPGVGLIGENAESKIPPLGKLPDAESLDVKGMETVYKGGSVSRAVLDMVEKGEISKKDFLDAWNNPDSVVDVKGEKVHVSKMGLVYEGNQVKFIPGENGGKPRFIVLEGKGGAYGSDKDLYARYQELKKPAPAWLEKSVTGKVSGAEIVKNLSETAQDTAETASQHTESIIGGVMNEYVQSEFPQIYMEYSTPNMMTSANHVLVIEKLASEFDQTSLLTQRITVESLQPVKEYMGSILNDDALSSESGISEMARTMHSSIEEMEAWLSQTEKALADKFYELDIKKPAEMEALLGDKKASIKTLLENQLEKPDYSKEKLFNWIKGLKPNQQELNLNLDTFVRSRFR